VNESSRIESQKILWRDPWPIWLWLFLLFLAASLSLAVEAALGNFAALLVSALQALLLIWASLTTPLRIEVSNERVRVGRAVIERGFISAVRELDSKEMALTRGRDADPRCWMALRFWVGTGVKIEINDPKDPTPYWLVSTKKAAAVATALITP
jgi:Protein of unknown function (DUF3093)